MVSNEQKNERENTLEYELPLISVEKVKVFARSHSQGVQNSTDSLLECVRSLWPVVNCHVILNM